MEEYNQNKEPLNKDFKAKKVSLNQICNIFDGTHQTPHYLHEGVPFVSVENIKDLNDTDKFISKKDFENLYPVKPKKEDILMTRIGDIGTPAIVNSNSDLAFYVSLALIRVVVKDVNIKYLYYYIQSQHFKKELYKRTIHNAFPIKINKNEIGKCLVILKNFYEQTYISDLLSIIDKKLSLVISKIEALKKYREGLIQIGLYQVYSSNSFVSFSDLYVDINERNINGLNQYTVGKEGLKPIFESNYNLQNHKIFHPNCLLIGIGIEEIAVSLNDSGSVSPVYNVYRINNKEYLNYTRFFLKSILWRKKAFITRKSTRREYEIDIRELLRFNLPIPVDLQFNKVCKSVDALDIIIQQLTTKSKLLNKMKSYLLKNMFI